MDDREFIPLDKGFPIYKPNPDFTGNKFLTFIRYKIRLSRNFNCENKGDNFYKKGEIYKVERIPSGKLYLLDNSDRCFYSNAIEGRDFELLKEEKE